MRVHDVKRLALVSMLVLAPATAADDAKIDCSKAVTQYDMDVCANRDFEAADRELNAAYRKVMALQDDKASREKLITAERAWVAYRDAECTFATADSEGGSIYPMNYSMCLTRQTKTHIKDLDSYLACQNDASTC